MFRRGLLLLIILKTRGDIVNVRCYLSKAVYKCVMEGVKILNKGVKRIYNGKL